MRSRLVKNRLTSSPRSAMRAICSALIGLCILLAFFIKFSFFGRGFPKCDEMKIFSFIILANFVNHRIEPSLDPANRTKLLGSIGPAVKAVRQPEEVLRFLKTHSPARSPDQLTALSHLQINPAPRINLMQHST